MLYLIAKALLSGVIIMAASEAAKRSPTYGALLVSLPLISILAMVWLWRETGDNERIAALWQGTFWLVRVSGWCLVERQWYCQLGPLEASPHRVGRLAYESVSSYLAR